jgi:hypothetical protein
MCINTSLCLLVLLLILCLTQQSSPALLKPTKYLVMSVSVSAFFCLLPLNEQTKVTMCFLFLNFKYVLSFCLSKFCWWASSCKNLGRKNACAGCRCLAMWVFGVLGVEYMGSVALVGGVEYINPSWFILSSPQYYTLLILY